MSERKGSRASGTNPRALGTNPRSNRRVRRAIAKAAWEVAPVAGSMLPRWLRFEILKRDAFCCTYCGARPKDGVRLQVDHIKPKAEGGTDDPKNLTTSCEDCNGGKGARVLHRSAL